jgi:hypothetical protein
MQAMLGDGPLVESVASRAVTVYSLNGQSFPFKSYACGQRFQIRKLAVSSEFTERSPVGAPDRQPPPE